MDKPVTPRLSLDLQQRQTLVMTPQLQQSIKLLQMATLDLAAYLEEQVLENPLLQLEAPGESEGAEEVERPREESGPRDVYEAGQAKELPEGATEPSEGWEAEATPYSEAGYWGMSVSSSPYGGSDEEGNPLEQTVAGSVGFREHLRQQILLEFSGLEQGIALALVDLVDEAGYLQEPLRNVAESLGCELALVEAVLVKAQQLEPAGVFARDLQECLTLQLKERNRYDPAIESLLSHLDLISRGDMAGLVKACGMPADEVREMIAELRHLHPKPGLLYADEPDLPVRPDVVVRADGLGGWRIELVNDALPRVLVNRQYHAHVEAHARSAEDKKYLSEQWQHANWLVKAVDQRALTILKVTTEIVRQQDLFLKYGVRYLKPLTLKDISEAIGMHESTVSRVTTQKYLQCSRGIFELKYFFTSGVQSSGLVQGEMSSEAVKEQIRTLIGQENPAKPMSDDQLMDVLRDRGIDIARRTVAKYREALGFGSSTDRRRAHKMSG